jgi:hypothetical protein
MFKCDRCTALQSEVEHLRAQNKDLLDRCMALADARAFAAVRCDPVESPEYFGGGDDDLIAYDEFGQRVIVKQTRGAQ